MDKIQEAVNEQVNELLKQRVGEAVQQLDIPAAVNKYLQTRFDNPNFRQFVGKQVLESVEGLNVSGQTLKLIDTKVNNAINSQVPAIQQLVRSRVDQILTQTIEQLVRSFSFPEASIPVRSIDWSNFKISVNNVDGYRPLSSIEDLGTSVELTVLDGAVVIENKIITNTVKAQDIEAHNIKTKYLEVGDLFKNSIADYVIGRLPKSDTTELDNKITELREQINTRKNSFRELEVTGEAVLSDVLYTTPGNRRVGINTMEPSDALTVWDSEVEVVVGKHKAQEGYIGTRRRQELNIGANNKVGIVIKNDGTVAIDKLQLLNRTISENETVPGFAAKRGDIVLNSNPQSGKFVGWVCLDGIRWSGFGRIE